MERFGEVSVGILNFMNFFSGMGVIGVTQTRVSPFALSVNEARDFYSRDKALRFKDDSV